MRNVGSLIHVGANFGGERFLYDEFGLNVLWVEPIELVFEELQQNLAGFPNQNAVRALVTSCDGEDVCFNISSNGGLSSSIFAIGEHADIWPTVRMEESVSMTTTSLDSIAQRSDRPRWDALVMDVQGAELEVLRGGENTISGMQYILAEAADFNAYEGGCVLQDLIDFLTPRGFRVNRKTVFAKHPRCGAYVNVLFERRPK